MVAAVLKFLELKLQEQWDLYIGKDNVSKGQWVGASLVVQWEQIPLQEFALQCRGDMGSIPGHGAKLRELRSYMP